jgi:5-formyltetrahydrofolate cyclo-ligase
LVSSDAKRALRAELIASRARLSIEERARRSLAVAERLAALPLFRDARVVALYAPLGTEVDSTEMARAVLARGGEVAYPRTVPGERRLVFARCDRAELVKGPLGAGEPPPDAREVPLDALGCVVTPGVAFSEDGVRLGRGGGYYDATLRLAPRVPRVGVAFDVQLVAALPREPHDAQLDAIVTESRTLRFDRDFR